MKKKLLTLAILLVLTNQLVAQAPVWVPQWNMKAGGTGEDIIGTFLITPDSGFVMCGTSFSGISGDKTQSNHDVSLATSDFWIVKTDSQGTILWEQRYGGTLTEILSESIITADGGLLAGGQAFSAISGDKSVPNWDTTLQSNDYWVIKTDNSGVKEWDQRYGGTSYELFGSLQQTADGGYILTGSSFSTADGDKTEPSRGGWDYWVVRTDATGNLIWDKRFGGTGDDFSNSVVLTADGNFLVGGYSSSDVNGDKSEPGRGATDFWIVKIDAAGTKLWDKTFGGNYNDWLYALTPTSDGGFILGGQSYSENTGDKTEPNHEPAPGGSDRWIVKIDSAGTIQWDRTIGGDEAEDVARIIQTTDGGYLVSGESYSDATGDKTENNLGPEQTWIVKLDPSGVVEWDKTLFTYGHDELGSALPWGEKCFVAVNFTKADTGGYKTIDSWGYADYWMIKMCDESTVSTPEIPGTAVNWQCLPTPVHDELILVSNSSFSDVTVEMYDVSGKLLSEMKLLSGATGTTIRMNVSELSGGIYFCKIIDGKKVYNIRVVKAG